MGAVLAAGDGAEQGKVTHEAAAQLRFLGGELGAEGFERGGHFGCLPTGGRGDIVVSSAATRKGAQQCDLGAGPRQYEAGGAGVADVAALFRPTKVGCGLGAISSLRGCGGIQGLWRCGGGLVVLADWLVGESVVAQAVGGKIEFVWPGQADAAAQDCHLGDKIVGFVEGGEKLAALDEGGEIDDAAGAVGPGDGDGVVGVRYGVLDFVQHGQSTIF